jgi:NADPH:quinone reductase-like Zn-dependent oxidoreductase
VTGVCSGRNLEFAASLGCERVIDYEREFFDTGGGRYDLVFDAIGRESPGRCRAVLAPGGRHVTTVPRREALRRAAADLFLGRVPGRLPTRLVLVRSSGRDLNDLARMAAAGRLATRVEKVWPLEAVTDALAASRAGRTRGKLVLRMDPGA